MTHEPKTLSTGYMSARVCQIRPVGSIAYYRRFCIRGRYGRCRSTDLSGKRACLVLTRCDVGDVTRSSKQRTPVMAAMRLPKKFHGNKGGFSECARPSLREAMRGFTLIELLIAISLLALISVVVYSAIWTASRSLHAVEKRVEVNDEVRVAQQFLRQALAQSRGVMEINDGVMGVVFQGEQDAVTFVAPAPLQRGTAGGLFRYRLEFSGSQPSQRSLRLSYWQYVSGAPLDEKEKPQGEAVLSEGVEALRLSYYGSKKPDSEKEWMDEWTRTDSLPLLIRIALKRVTDEETVKMIVAIKGQVG